MIVSLIAKLGNGDEVHTFGGIACDVEGCEALSPPFNDGADAQRKGLVEEGWFIAPGRHRCPKHFYDDVPGRGIVKRDVGEIVSKRI